MAGFRPIHEADGYFRRDPYFLIDTANKFQNQSLTYLTYVNVVDLKFDTVNLKNI